MRQLEGYLAKDLLAAQGSSLVEAVRALTGAVEYFVGLMSELPDEKLSTPIGPDRWSPAEYADHVYRATVLYCSLVEQACSGQAPRKFERGWLRNDGRMITPAEAEPAAGRDRAELIGDLRSATGSLVTTAERAGELGRLDHVCHINPYFGPLTVLECVQLAAVHARYHAERHIGLA